jgi:tetratricopeptide (TPR) repeat protein
MNRAARLVTVIAIAAVLLSAAGCTKLRARDELNKGIKSYKNANYEQAINHFQEAVRLDENLKVAKLYLATAYAQQYVPGVVSPENMNNAKLAINDTTACWPMTRRTSTASKASATST